MTIYREGFPQNLHLTMNIRKGTPIKRIPHPTMNISNFSDKMLCANYYIISSVYEIGWYKLGSSLIKPGKKDGSYQKKLEIDVGF